MTTLREAAQQALEAWQTATYGHPSHHKATLLAMTALRAALAEPVQEPMQEQDGPICDGWQLSVTNGHSGYGVYAHMEEYPEEGAVLVLPIQQPVQEPVATVTECEACFTPDVCQLRGICDHYAATQLRISAPPQREPEPVQEPFGYLWPTGRHPEFRFTQQKRDGVDGMPLYTAPPQRKPLTEEKIWHIYKNLWMFHPAEEPRLAGDVLKFARAIEAANGIRGNK